MKKRYKNGAIGILEIFITLVILAVLYEVAFKANASKKEQTDIEETIDKISTLVSYGIYDIYKGYATSGGGNCSSGYDVKNISAKRIQLCTDIPFETIEEDASNPKDGTKSYFVFLDRYAIAERGCKIYVDEFDDFTTRLLVDCSGLDPKLHKMIEEKFAKRLSKKLELMYKASYPDAINYTDLNSGNNEDGILIIEFQK